MVREPGVEYLEAIYSVMNREHRYEEIFKADQDQEHLLATLGERLCNGVLSTAQRIVHAELPRRRWQESDLKAT